LEFAWPVAKTAVPSGVVWLTPLHELAPTTTLVFALIVTTMSAVVLFGLVSDQNCVRSPLAFVASELGTAASACEPKATLETVAVLLDQETPTSRRRSAELPTAKDASVHVVLELMVHVLLVVLSPVTICA